MIACVDVHYRPAEVVTACVGIRDWTDAQPYLERVSRGAQPAAPYRSGQFYLREMPFLVDLLATIEPVELVIIDGYVWLARDRPGLGAHLYARLDARFPVVGVAKRPFRNHDCAIAVVRGSSRRPLFVTAVGIDTGIAAAGVASMHGRHRLPTILKRVDRLARGG